MLGNQEIGFIKLKIRLGTLDGFFDRDVHREVTQRGAYYIYV